MSSLDWDEIKDTTFKCLRCGHTFKGEQMITRDRVVCPVCGYKIVAKIRPPIAKRIRAV